MGESCTGVMDVGLRRIEETVLVEVLAASSSFSSSSPRLTLSNSDLFMYFLP